LARSGGRRRARDRAVGAARALFVGREHGVRAAA
jgi:hypothetical protein